MCGIVGLYTNNREDYQSQVIEMTYELAHRGPDAQGYFGDACCYLGHRRLSILDTSDSANQPFHSSCERFVMVFNGEVYNFRELITKYNIEVKTNSDTEVILELFTRIGTKFVDMLNGMFTIAIYDKKEKTLCLFRDRLGIKPLYYYHSENIFAFASELKSLKKFLKEELVPDDSAIATYLYLGYVPEPLTIYRDVKKFGAGHFATVTEKGISFEKYWEPSSQIADRTLDDLVVAKEQLGGLLTSSVNYRLISDVPLGTFLSGGTDSSLVTAIAQKESNFPIKTFSIGFKESKYNESDHAREVASYLKTDHYEFILSEKDAQEKVVDLVSIYDEPFADSSAIPTLLVSEMARKEVTVTLSGDGGDELFMGYGMYNWAARLSNPLIRSVRKPISILLNFGRNRERRASRVFDYSNKDRIKSHIFSQEQYFFSEIEIKHLLTKKSILEIVEDYPELRRSLSAREEQAFFDLNNYLKSDLLVKVDRASMFHSLETRVPLLDHRIVEFALNLDESLKIRNGTQKYLLKQVLYDFVPQSILERPKWGFSIPLQNWLKNELNYLVDKYLSKLSIETHNIVNYDQVKLLLDAFSQGQDFLYNRIWTLIILHMWLEDNG
ncbi:MAG: asparagine synthase (glutamine-hydrolyzing) [Cyclobacteriaceae bacterium]